MSARGNDAKNADAGGASRSGDQRQMVVLTGDIVDSTRRSGGEPQVLARVLQAAADAVRDALPSAGISSLAIFRGDGWQLLVEKPEAGLRAALLFRSHLLGGAARGAEDWETRIGLGLGTVRWVEPDQVSRSQGEAFEASGEALDCLAEGRQRLAVRGAPSLHCGAVVMALLDAVIGHWTSRQAWAIHGALRGFSQVAIGETFTPPLHQRTVADHLRRGDWEALESALRWWEEITQ